MSQPPSSTGPGWNTPDEGISGPYLPGDGLTPSGRSHNQPSQPYWLPKSDETLPSQSSNPSVAQGAAPQDAASPRLEVDRKRRPVAAVIGAIVLAVALVVGLIVSGLLTETPSPSAASSSTASPTESARRSASPGTQAIQVTSEYDGAQVWWEILGVTWDSTGVTIDTRLTGDSGTLRYTFFALDNKNVEQYYPDSNYPNAIDTGEVRQGQVVSGNVRFDKPRGDTTVYIANSSGRQITALVIKG